MSEVNVVEVESSKQLKEFILYPNRLYAGDPNYVTPLYAERKEFFDFKNNPFYRTAKVQMFLAMRDEDVVGPASATVTTTITTSAPASSGFWTRPTTRKSPASCSKWP
jgi:hypothetical protein